MKTELDFTQLKEYLYFINIESNTKIGSYKRQSMEYLLKNYKTLDHLIDKDWEIIQLNDEKISYLTLRVGTYINHTLKSLVIALSGTTNTRDIKPDLEILSGKIPARLKKFETYLNQYLSYENIQSYQRAGYNITFTGHSLGGFLAQLGYIKYKLQNPSFQAKVVAFDSPGAKKHALKILTQQYLITNSKIEAKRLAEEEFEKGSYKYDIFNVIRKFNAINISGEQIGLYVLILEPYLKITRLSQFNLWKNLAYHRLHTFINAIKHPEIYNFYVLQKPIFSEAILIKPAEKCLKTILLTIKEIQQKSAPQKIFSNYVNKVLRTLKNNLNSIEPNSTLFFQTKESIEYLETSLKEEFEFIDRSRFLIKISDFIKGLQGKKRFLDSQYDNVVKLDKIIKSLSHDYHSSLKLQNNLPQIFHIKSPIFTENFSKSQINLD